VTKGAAEKLDCPLPPIGAIDLVGKKWALCVVALLGRYGTVRFGPIQKSLSGISPATLTKMLRSLERDGLIHRVPVWGRTGTVEAYSLTGSGRSLARSIRPLAHWLGAKRTKRSSTKPRDLLGN